MTTNPHFDEERVIWNDSYSGLYSPVEYSQQFDDQWRLFLERKAGFHSHTGVDTSDPYIDDRIYELTGTTSFLERKKHPVLHPILKIIRKLNGQEKRRDIGGRLFLEPKFPLSFFQGKQCLDVGCGAGRWTRTMIELGAKVKSADASEHGIDSTRRFNKDVEQLNLFDIIEKRPDLHERFDFTLCWGVIMCTHDPKLAFDNVAKTVKPGGQLYTMIYAPTYHNSEWVLEKRSHYHKNLTTIEEKIAYAYEIADKPENAINLLDMLNTFYNWTVTEETIHNWYRKHGFGDIITLNRNEPDKCAFHVVGTKIPKVSP